MGHLSHVQGTRSPLPIPGVHLGCFPFGALTYWTCNPVLSSWVLFQRSPSSPCLRPPGIGRLCSGSSLVAFLCLGLSHLRQSSRYRAAGIDKPTCHQGLPSRQGARGVQRPPTCPSDPGSSLLVSAWVAAPVDASTGSRHPGFRGHLVVQEEDGMSPCIPPSPRCPAELPARRLHPLCEGVPAGGPGADPR